MRTVFTRITGCCIRFRFRLLLALSCVVALHAGVLLHASGLSNVHIPKHSARDVLMVSMVSRPMAKESESVRETAADSVTVFQSESSALTDTASAAVLKTKPRSAIKNTRIAVKEKSNSAQDVSSDKVSNSTAQDAKPIHLTQPSFKGARPTPEYPQHALTLRQEGVVIIRILISKQGEVIEASIHQSSGSELLDIAAKQAALRAQFYPYLQDGVPHISQADLPFNFMLKKL